MARAAQTKKTPKPAAKKASKKPAAKAPATASRFRPVRWLLRWSFRLAMIALALAVFLVLAFRVIDPPYTYYMWSESRRLDGIDHQWVPMGSIAPVMQRAAVAAEDANFCNHWGIDMAALRQAIEEGGNRGASTISQQVVKNVFLWQGRSYVRKALEAGITPLMEALWPKRRILEVYLNVAEFDEGVFGVEAASRHYFGVGPDALSPTQAARLAAILPAPKDRSAANPSSFVRKRAAQIVSGAETIRVDGRADCFQ